MKASRVRLPALAASPGTRCGRFRGRSAGFLAIAIFGVAVATPANAQVGKDSADGPIVGGNPLQTPSIQGRAWTLEAGLVSIYDSNFRARTPPESAVRISPIVRIGAGLPIGRQQLFVGADVGRDIFINQPEFNRGRYALGGGVEWRLGTRCSGVVGAETLQRLVTVSEQDEFTNAVQKTNVIAGSLGCQTATGLGFAVTAQRRSLRNDTAQRALFNLDSTVVSPSINYGSPTIGQLSLSAVFNNTRFPNRLVVTPDGALADGVNILQGRIGYSRGLGSRLQVAVGASYVQTAPQPAEALLIMGNQLVLVPRDSFKGSGYDGSINFRASDRMNINVAANRSVNVSANVGAQFVIRNDYGADFSYRIGPSLTFGAGGRIARNQYRAMFTSPFATNRIADSSRRLSANLDYAPVPLYSVGLDVAHITRSSNPASFSFSSTTVRLNIRVRLGSR